MSYPRRSMMSERNGLRYGLLGLAVLILLALLLLVVRRPDAPATQAVPVDSAKIESLAEINGQAPNGRHLNIQTWQTAEGAKVLFVEARELPMLDLRLTFAAGSSQDDGVQGLAMLTNAMLNEGVPGKAAGPIAAVFESLGAEFGNGAYRDMAVASLRSLSAAQQREPALQLFNQVIGQPTFPEDALARIKNQLLAGFEYQKQNPGKLASLQLFERLYGEHPYAHPSEGNAVLALVGDLSREEAEAIASAVSAALPQGPALPRITQPETPKAGLQHIEFPSNQTHLMIAQLGIDRRDPDYAALYLGNQVFGGGGFGTRLM